MPVGASSRKPQFRAHRASHCPESMPAGHLTTSDAASHGWREASARIGRRSSRRPRPRSIQGLEPASDCQAQPDRRRGSCDALRGIGLGMEMRVSPHGSADLAQMPRRASRGGGRPGAVRRMDRGTRRRAGPETTVPREMPGPRRIAGCSRRGGPPVPAAAPGRPGPVRAADRRDGRDALVLHSRPHGSDREE